MSPSPKPSPGGWGEGAAALGFRRVHVRLTRTGALYIVLTLALGVVAVNSGNNLLYISVSGLLALLTLSGVLGLANLRGLAPRLRPPGEVYAGMPVSAVLELANRKRRVPSFLLDLRGYDPVGTLVEVRPAETGSLDLRLAFDRRGRRPLPELTLVSSFPFGLIERGGTFAPPGTCLVYPRPEAVDWNLLVQAERRGEDRPLPIAGAGGDWRGFREYSPGDAISRIHWKGWLRHRRLMTKEFEAEGAAPVVFDYSEVPGPGHEARLSQLTWLVRTALRRGRAVGLRLPGRSFAPSAGAGHRKKMLTALALEGEADERP